MNDPGLEEPIQDSAKSAERHVKRSVSNEKHSKKLLSGPGIRAAFRKELLQDEEEEEVGYFQPKRWWFTSTAFPLVAGTFGPLANFFSICALTQSWRQYVADGSSIPDPTWLNVITGLSLAFSLIANVVLMANFGHGLPYSIAQPITISLWYFAAILLIIPLGLTHTALKLSGGPAYELTQSYYYAIITAAIYIILPSLLVVNAIGAYVFHAYPPSFNALTVPQRTLMLQTTVYVMYLAAGAGVFSHVENWNYLDAVYWSDYSLLTIGLGSDFPPQTHTGRSLLIPFAVVGITLIGVVIGSIRGLVLERGKVKVMRRTVELERQKWISRMDEPDTAWKKEEWEIMRRIQRRAKTIRKYSSLGSSLFAFLALWFLGAMVFWFSEAPQSWTYFESVYFSFVVLLTIGYGDFIPQSNAGKPFFVLWSLTAVPTVTILISNVGDILVDWVRDGLMLGIGHPPTPPEQSTKKPGTAEEDDLHRMGSDVEHLGSAVERAEEELGRGGGFNTGIEYAWEDWDGWLTLLGERTDSEKSANSNSSGDSVQIKEKRGEWTWLGDDGPLFSGVSETQWILGKLCQRLEEVLKQEMGAGQ
ncbi:hypothetical protein MSAN_02114900 [Mycena sanguinolenta]|uniref:Potassium channel domain-containing protein n=1 Tax=Mycena sanguinolenta TaxID=230812 RepID=A0A8H7CKB4_9AGAR|nr:hypothetical protein MSAN_02114900 [Mycena sanguinolenta]